MTSLNASLENFEEEWINSIDSIFDAYFLLSKENFVLAYNIKDELLNLYLGKENFQGGDFFNIFKFQTQQEGIKELRQKISEKKPQQFEVGIKVNDHTWYYNIFIFILSNDQILINFQNINKQKQIEFELRESEERYRSLVETTSDWIWEVDANSIFTYSSPKIKDILGYEPKEIIGKTPFDFMPLDEANRVREIFQTILESDKSFKILENINLHKDGSPIILGASGVPIFDENGQVLGYRGISRDITKRKNAEQKLVESEEMYRNLFNTTPYGIWLVNLKGEILDCNEPMNNFMSIFKHTDLIGKPFRDVLLMFAREGDPRFENIEKLMKDRFKILLKQGYIKPVEFEIHRGDGKTYWITLESSFVKIGKKRLIQTFIKDITEKKLAEIELDGLRKELETRVKERTIKLEDSEKKYRKAYNRADCYKGLFTHDISNIFQTVGNSIELSQMLLEEGFNKKDMQEYFDIIAQQINRGKNLINNIRNLSEIEESEMPLESIEVFENLKSAIQFVRVNFQKREIKISLDSSINELYVLANDLLLDVFENILINAVRYNKDEVVEIEIKISRVIDNGKPYIKLEFKDNGIGIDDNKKKLIFDKNYKKKIGSKGMGLGLSLVAKLLDLCKGKIWVEDKIEGDHTQGSNFVIQIPEAT